MQKTFVGPEDASDSEEDEDDETSEPVTINTDQTNPEENASAPTLMLPCIYCGSKYKVNVNIMFLVALV